MIEKTPRRTQGVAPLGVTVSGKSPLGKCVVGQGHGMQGVERGTGDRQGQGWEYRAGGPEATQP